MIGWDINEQSMGVTALCVANGAGMLVAFNPPVFNIRAMGATTAPNTDSARTLHAGMVLGSAISIVVALGGTLVSRSWWPLFGTLLGLAVLCGAQEWAIRNPHAVKEA